MFFTFWYVMPRKIWQPWSQPSELSSVSWEKKEMSFFAATRIFIIRNISKNVKSSSRGERRSSQLRGSSGRFGRGAAAGERSGAAEIGRTAGDFRKVKFSQGRAQ
jgi:hypothetical protein